MFDHLIDRAADAVEIVPLRAQRLEAWKGLKVEHRMFIKVACASHFVSFERGRHLLYRATQSWLAGGVVDGAQRGEFLADVQGHLTPSPT